MWGRLDKRTNLKALQLCAGYFRKAKHMDYCKETYIMLDDYKSLIDLYVEEQKWNEAFAIVKSRPGMT